MKRTLVRYKTKPETREQNRRLIENVFAELRAKSPDGVRYMVLMLEDGSFLHFVESRDPDNSVPKLDAFKLFQGGIRIAAPSRRRRARQSSWAITGCWVNNEGDCQRPRRKPGGVRPPAR